MKIAKEIVSWVLTIVVAFLFAILISGFVFQQTQVQGKSMEPTLQDNDKVFVSKLVNIINYEPEYGDIVIIDSRIDTPRKITDDLIGSVKNYLITSVIFDIKQEENYWIKRVIGKAGDVIEFKDGQVIRNGEILIETYIKEEGIYYSDDKIVVVPEDHIFVMGDNRNYSKDSRQIGSIPIDHVVGKYKFKY